MKYLKTILLASLVALILPACSDSNDNYTNTQSMALKASDSFISSYSIKDNTTYALSGAPILLTVDFANSTIQLSANSLQYDPNELAISFELPATPFSYKESGWELTSTATFDIESGSHHTISDLNIKFNSRANGMQVLTKLSFIVDNNYDVCFIFRQNVFSGTTRTFDINNPSDVFTTENPLYMVQLNSDGKTAFLAIANPQFVSNMPSTISSMQFPALNVKYIRGGIQFESEKLTPTIGNTPYPKYEITDFNGIMVLGSSLNLDFKCMAFTREVEVTGKPY